jgi:hypothetical protein
MQLPQSVSTNYMWGVCTALFIVWMQRNKRWALMIHTMDGTYKVQSTKS